MTKKLTKTSTKKSTGMKTRLTPFCTVKQNPLPLACLGVEGEGNTHKKSCAITMFWHSNRE